MFESSLCKRKFSVNSNVANTNGSVQIDSKKLCFRSEMSEQGTMEIEKVFLAHKCTSDLFSLIHTIFTCKMPELIAMTHSNF